MFKAAGVLRRCFFINSYSYKPVCQDGVTFVNFFCDLIFLVGKRYVSLGNPFSDTSSREIFPSTKSSPNVGCPYIGREFDRFGKVTLIFHYSINILVGKP